MNKIIGLLLLISAVTSCAQSSKSNKSEQVITTQVSSNIALDNNVDTLWETKIIKAKEEWKKILTADQYYITREEGTERPFTSEYNNNHEEGIFVCVCCNNPLFSSKAKFNSGTGWPSFFDKYSRKSLVVSNDGSAGMSRDALTCGRCEAHLGHVFNDGPKPTGLRYCIDGVALRLIPVIQESEVPQLSKATFAAGCFWCEEYVFEQIKGVKEVVSGYSGGNTDNPSYEEVGAGITKHAEAFQISYDSNLISYESLLKVLIASMDPTQVNGQGPDNGSQYRSIIFYSNQEEKRLAENYLKSLDESRKYSKPISIEIIQFTKFWKAEEYHQNYVLNHPENPYVQHESIPRAKRTKSRVPEFFN